MRQVMAFTYLQQGVPCLYYGDEIGLTGDMDPDCRKCMIWEEEKQDRDLLHFTRSLINIRKDNQKVLSEGSLSWNWVSEEDGLIIFERELGHSGSSVFSIRAMTKSPFLVLIRS